MKLKRILLPVDFSPASLSAAKQAGFLARHFHSEVTMLHVYDTLAQTPPLAFSGDLPGWQVPYAEYESAARAQLDTFGVRELGEVEVRRIVCSGGDPAPVIVGLAETDKADLILMPTHGHGKLRRLLLGSVTAKVLHDANCPVWTGTHFEDPLWPELSTVKQVLCAVNFSPHSGEVVQSAADFANEFGARLTVVHAITETPPELPDRYIMSWHDEARCGSDERLHLLLRELSVPAEVQILDGDVATALAQAARHAESGLMFIGRSSTDGAFGRLSSRAYGIICQAPCPVVSI